MYFSQVVLEHARTCYELMCGTGLGLKTLPKILTAQRNTDLNYNISTFWLFFHLDK